MASHFFPSQDIQRIVRGFQARALKDVYFKEWVTRQYAPTVYFGVCAAVRHAAAKHIQRIARGWERRRDVVEGLVLTADYAAGLEWASENESRWSKDPYTFSKQCVTLWTKLAAQRGAQGDLRVNSVSPGGVETQLSPSFNAEPITMRQVSDMATSPCWNFYSGIPGLPHVGDTRMEQWRNHLL